MEVQGVNHFSVMDLERRTYRYLQQLAKSLSLPSNVKKVCLIQLIHAKKFKTEEEVNTIIQQVKEERKQLALIRKRNKKHVQNKEISSTCISHSPPISRTPKRPVHAVLRYSPDFQPSLSRYNPKHTFSANIARSVASSDRVLRSFNLKALRNSYGSFNVCNTQTVSAISKNQSTSPKQPMLHIMDRSGRLSRANVAAKRIDVRRRQSILNGNSCLALRNENQNRCIIAHEERPKRERTLSGIYPHLAPIPLAMAHRNFEQTHGVRLRRTDGRLSTLNALVHKRNITPYKPAYPRPEISIQDLINTIDANINETDVNTNYMQSYPNLTSQVDCNRNYMPVPTYKENLEGYSVYYHKKIRSEQVRCQRITCRGSEEDRLPKITDVFSRFNGEPSRNAIHPLYVHVTDVSETAPSYTAHPGRNIASSHMLESLYNFKNILLTNTPLLQIATTSNTKCVYSTPVIATAVAQHSTTLVASEPFNMPPCEPDNQYRCSHDIELPHLYDSIRHSDPDYALRRFVNSEDLSRTTSSLDTSQSQMGGSVTIPEMVEDALEIISQDGDYMEQIGIDIRVQCVLCSWAGPKIILEFHIRKEHPTQIHKPSKTEYKLDYTLGSLLQTPLWINQVLEHDGELYVISVKYESPDCLMATLSSLCPEPDPMERQGSITIYNKVSGEPYLWEGHIQPLPPNLPYENDITCLNLQLSKLDLLPNSANLKLHNEELVLKSPTKVVVGQPEFNNIHITLSVKIS